MSRPHVSYRVLSNDKYNIGEPVFHQESEIAFWTGQLTEKSEYPDRDNR